MAVIPDTTAFGRRPDPVAQGTFIPTDRSAVGLGEAIAEAGAVLGNVAKKKRQREDEFAYKKAQSDLLLSSVEANKSLEEIEDYTTWQKEYEDSMAKAKEEAAKSIRSNHDRALFDLAAQNTIVNGSEDVRVRALKREVDDDRSTLESQLEKLHNAAMESDNSDVRRQIINAGKDLINGAEVKQSITAQEAQDMDSKWSKGIAEGALILLPPDKRAEMLARPQGTLAEAIPADRRVILLRQAQAEDKETRNRGSSQSEADQIMAKHSEDRTSALAEARKVKDPDVRAMTVANVNQRFNEANAIKLEQDRAQFDAAADVIDNGGKVNDIAPRVWVELSSTQQQALKDLQLQKETGVMPVHDPEKWYQWFDETSIEEQANTNLLELRPYFDASHFEKAQDRQRAVKDAMAGGKDGVQSLKSTQTFKQMIAGALVGSPLFPKPPKSPAAKTRYSQIEDKVAERKDLEEAARGRSLTALEMRELIDRSVLDIYYVEEWGVDPKRAAIELKPEEIESAYIKYADIPEGSRLRLENLAESYGFTKNKDRIEKAYAAAKLQQGNERIIEILQGQ